MSALKKRGLETQGSAKAGGRDYDITWLEVRLTVRARSQKNWRELAINLEAPDLVKAERELMLLNDLVAASTYEQRVASRRYALSVLPFGWDDAFVKSVEGIFSVTETRRSQRIETGDEPMLGDQSLLNNPQGDPS